MKDRLCTNARCTIRTSTVKVKLKLADRPETATEYFCGPRHAAQWLREYAQAVEDSLKPREHLKRAGR